MAEEKKSDVEAKATTKKPAAKKDAPKSSDAKGTAKAATTAKKDTAKSSEAKAPAKTTRQSAEAGTAEASSAPAKAGAAKKKNTASSEKSSAKKTDDVVARPQVLKVHHLRPAPGAKKDRTRVGRGEGSKGKTAGRGTKGTKARYQVRPGFQGGQLPFHMRSPKLRGFKNPFRVEYQVVNLEKLAELYPSGGDVTVSDLVAKGAVRKNEKVKVLGAGDIAVKLNVEVDKVSGSAEQKIVAAGGSVK